MAEQESLPSHVQSTIDMIAELHAEHRNQATPFERFAIGLTARATQPSSITWLTVATASWIIVNLLLMRSGRSPFDAPPFQWLELSASLAALYMTVLIVSTQRREDDLADHRAQLSLQLAIQADQKAAKIIELLHHLRQDHPSMESRVDPDAHEMAKPADPKAVSNAIKSAQ